MSTLLLEHGVEIPAIGGLSDFRHWALSETFPQRGRIDYIAGRIEVDMSPEDVFTHGTLKTEIAARIKDRVDELDLGHTLTAETRVSSIAANLSVEPDVVVLSHQAVDDGRVTFVPKAGGAPDRFVEVAGAPDLIVEIVSDSSEKKDTGRLPAAYFTAGVREFWLVDARGTDLQFQVLVRGHDGFESSAIDPDGWRRSGVLHAAVLLERHRHARGHWTYRLRIRAL